MNVSVISIVLVVGRISIVGLTFASPDTLPLFPVVVSSLSYAVPDGIVSLTLQS